MKDSFHNSLCSRRLSSDLIRGLTFALLLPTLLPAQATPTGLSTPIIDMHFHTLWDGPEQKEALTGFISPKTPDELRRLNMAAVNRYHMVKVVAAAINQALVSKIVTSWQPRPNTAPAKLPFSNSAKHGSVGAMLG